MAKPKNRWALETAQGPDEPQAAVEEERIDECKPQRDAVTAIPRAGTLQGVVPLRQRQRRVNLSPLETTRPSSISASRNSHVHNVDEWAMGQTVTLPGQSKEG